MGPLPFLVGGAALLIAALSKKVSPGPFPGTFLKTVSTTPPGKPAPDAPPATPLLGSANGANGMQIQCVQQALNQRYAGSVSIKEDGFWGPDTADAVRRAQLDLGQPPTGSLTPAFLQATGCANKGVGTAEEILKSRRLCAQKILNATPRPDGSRYEHVDEDGSMQSSFVRALKQFQGDYKIPQTGVLDAITLKTLQCT
jgi:peptidoglycan hydrolase-like protein with peptidoglycan-binding domain